MADLRTEMSAFLKQEGKPTEKQVETKQEVTKTDSENEGQDEEIVKDEEPKNLESKDETHEDEKPDEESKDEKEEGSKKPNRYQRLKAQRDEAVSQHRKIKDEFYKAVKVANAWRAEAKTFEAEIQRIKEEAKTKGFQRSAERERLFDFEREHAVRTVEDEFDKQVKNEEVQDQAVQLKNALKEKFLEEASDLGAKYGVPQRKILVTFHAERSSGNRVSMEDIAKELGELEGIRKRKTGEDRQLEVNRSAPRTMKPGSPAKIDYPATPEGMKAYLKSIGAA